MSSDIEAQSTEPNPKVRPKEERNGSGLKDTYTRTFSSQESRDENPLSARQRAQPNMENEKSRPKETLHYAAKSGKLELFNQLLKDGAELTERGPEHMTPLDFAITNKRREIIQAVIQCDKWKEAFQMASTSPTGELDTPLRKLIRELPDLAKEVLERCWESEEPDYDVLLQDGGELNKQPIILMLDERRYELLDHPLCKSYGRCIKLIG